MRFFGDETEVTGSFSQELQGFDGRFVRSGVDGSVLLERGYFVRPDSVPTRTYFGYASRRSSEIDGRGETDVEKLERELFGYLGLMLGIRLFVNESEFPHFRKIQCRHRCRLNEFFDLLGRIGLHGCRWAFGFRPDSSENVYSVLLERYVLYSDEGFASEGIQFFLARIPSVRIVRRGKVAIPRPLPFLAFRLRKTGEPVRVARGGTLIRPSFEREDSVHGEKEIPLGVEIRVGQVLPNRDGVRFKFARISGNGSDFRFADFKVLGVRAYEFRDPVPYGIRNFGVRSFEYFG